MSQWLSATLLVGHTLMFWKPGCVRAENCQPYRKQCTNMQMLSAPPSGKCHIPKISDYHRIQLVFANKKTHHHTQQQPLCESELSESTAWRWIRVPTRVAMEEEVQSGVSQPWTQPRCFHFFWLGPLGCFLVQLCWVIWRVTKLTNKSDKSADTDSRCNTSVHAHTGEETRRMSEKQVGGHFHENLK